MKKFSEISTSEKLSFLLVILLSGLLLFAVMTIYKQYKYHQQLIADQKFIQDLRQENQRKLDEYKKANPDTTIKSLDDLDQIEKK